MARFWFRNKDAKEKIKKSEYHDNRVLVESLGIPGTRSRRGLFELLETLDIKELDVFMFAKKNLDKCYAYLAMSQNLEKQPSGKMRDLAIEHLIFQKELVLENIIRVLAIRDQTGRMKTAWRGVFSSKSTSVRTGIISGFILPRRPLIVSTFSSWPAFFIISLITFSA